MVGVNDKGHSAAHQGHTFNCVSKLILDSGKAKESEPSLVFQDRVFRSDQQSANDSLKICVDRRILEHLLRGMIDENGVLRRWVHYNSLVRIDVPELRAFVCPEFQRF